MPTEVTVTFVLNEEVTPFLFAEKVANGVFRSGVLREGEGVLQDSTFWLRTEDVTLEAGIVGKDEVVTPGITMIPLTRAMPPVAEARAWVKQYQDIGKQAST